MPEDRGNVQEQILERLTVMVGLLACVARGVRDSGAQIVVLDKLGLSSPTIAQVLGVKAVTVRSTLHRRRKKGK